MTRIAIVTFDGFNEIDSFVALNILNRVPRPGWRAEICAPTPRITSMNGVTIDATQPLEFANAADAVLIGSGRRTQEFANDKTLMARLKLDTARQLVGSQCSGALMVHTLGLLTSRRACTDRRTAPLLKNQGIEVIDRAFHADGNVATAGGCLSSQYLATWVICRLTDKRAAADALSYVVPVGEEAVHVERAFTAVFDLIDVSSK